MKKYFKKNYRSIAGGFAAGWLSSIWISWDDITFHFWFFVALMVVAGMTIKHYINRFNDESIWDELG